MIILTDILTALVALLHLSFMVLEMYYWDKPLGLRVFGHSPETAASSKVLAMNQGLYNGFLAAGLIWGIVMGSAGDVIKQFFLVCVVIAGVFGGVTASRKILWIQALPGLLALIVVSLA